MYILKDYVSDRWGDTITLYYHFRENAEAKAREIMKHELENYSGVYADLSDHYNTGCIEEIIEAAIKDGYCDDIFDISNLAFEDED